MKIRATEFSHARGPLHIEDLSLLEDNTLAFGWAVADEETECPDTAVALFHFKSDAALFAYASELFDFAYAQAKRNNADAMEILGKIADAKGETRTETP